MSHRHRLLDILPGSLNCSSATDGECLCQVHVRLDPAARGLAVPLRTISASHDGIVLNEISVAILPHKKAFEDAKKESTPKSAPEDLAEDYIAELQAGPTALRFPLRRSDAAVAAALAELRHLIVVAAAVWLTASDSNP